jgi:hypothetical protein
MEFEEEALSFSFVGFGTFESDEYFQLVLTNDESSGEAWRIQESDLVLQIRSSGVSLYNSSTYFFDITSNGAKLLSTKGITYRDNKTYFTIDFALPYADMPNINSKIATFHFMAVEFGSVGIYDTKGYTDNLRKDGRGVGDPAFQKNYPALVSPYDVINVSYDRKMSILNGQYPFSFSNPEDTGFSFTDDFYGKIVRKEDGIYFDLVGFGNFQNNECVKIVLHPGSEDLTETWKINKSDVSVIVNKDKGLIKNGLTNFFDLWNFSNNAKAMANAPTYERFDDYFTLSFHLGYDELYTIDNSCLLKIMIVETTTNDGAVLSKAPWTDTLRYNGLGVGDPASQKSYVAI